MAYTPDAIPDDCPAGLKAWLADQLRRVSVEFGRGVLVPVTGVEPAKPSPGQIVYAVSPWATSLGATGFYGYEEGTWKRLT